jgi:hypothetical protein
MTSPEQPHAAQALASPFTSRSTATADVGRAFSGRWDEDDVPVRIPFGFTMDVSTVKRPLTRTPETPLDRWRKLRGKFIPREFDPEAAKDLVNVVREFSDLRRRATTTILGDE